MKRKQKSFKDQLNDISIELFGTPCSPTNNHSSNDILLDKTKPTNINITGYEPRKVCNITMATLPINYSINPLRLDAPCEECINEQCPYSIGIINEFKEKNYGYRKNDKRTASGGGKTR